MNEQEFQQRLREQTDTTPIPESLAPEQIRERLHQSSPSKKWYRNPWFSVAAACIVIGILSISVLRISHPLTKYPENETSDPVGDPVSEPYASEKEGIADDARIIPTAGSYRHLYRILADHYQYDQFFDVENGVESAVDGDAAAATGSESAAEDSLDYYETNAQVEGIAEADITVTDGQYIYSCFPGEGSYTNNEVAIVRGTDGTLEGCCILSSDRLTADLASSYTGDAAQLHPDITEMYIYQDTLILMCNVFDETLDDVFYSCQSTCLLVYDVTDAEHPVHLSTLRQDGTYESSRLTDGYLYTFSKSYVYLDKTTTDVQDYDQYLPHVGGDYMGCDQIFLPECPNVPAYQIVTAFRIDDPAQFTDSKAILAGDGIYYMSPENIYFAESYWEDGNRSTEIMKFHYTDGTIQPQGSISVNGYLLNQFAMDEYQGNLRLAVTVMPSYDDTGIEPYRSATDDVAFIGGGQTNALYVISSDMELVGSIEHLAKDERIYSVRFMGDTGYFVTFRETDPLFAVDLSDPEHPTVMDALKVTGFSNYLHAYSEHLLLGFGEEVHPDTGEMLGLKLSMFDTSDPYHIQEIDKTVLPNSYYSTAQYNHKALLIQPERNLIGFYLHSYDEETFRQTCEYVIYSYTEGTGFQEQCRVDIQTDPILSDTQDSFAYYSDQVRGIYIGDFLYLINGNRICSYSLNTFEKQEGLILPDHDEPVHEVYP